MPLTNFNDPVIMDTGLMVSGPFDPNGAEYIGPVHVRFILMQDRATPQDSNVLLEGITTWNPDDQDPTKWQATVGVTKLAGLHAGRVRAIGIAVAIRQLDSDDPPAFETFTWCVNKVVQDLRT